MKRTEVVTSDGKFGYPSLDHVRNQDGDVWIRTDDGNVRYASCTLELYKMKSFTLEDKKRCASKNVSPFDE